MGDHRLIVKIHAEFHGVKRDLDGYYNWSPDDSQHPVDYRVVEFFRELHESGMEEYHQLIWESQREEREKEQERHDRAEYERLKAKYEPPAPSQGSP